jgi:hypothetical protein
VTYYSGNWPVAAASMVLTGATVATVQTDAIGAYAFSDVLDGSNEIVPNKTGDFGLGISPLDASYILQVLVGKRSFDANQALACDVTGNGRLSPLDATRILQFVVESLARFAVAVNCGSDWAFVPVPETVPNQTLVDPLVSEGSCGPGAIAYQPLVGPAGNQDFQAILFGDCTRNWQPTTGGGGSTLDSSAGSGPVVRAGRLQRVRGRTMRIRISVESPVPFHAVALRIGHEPAGLKFAEVRGLNLPAGALLTGAAVAPGSVAVALASAEEIPAGKSRILELEFRRTEQGRRFDAPQVLAATVDEQIARVHD